MRERPFTRTDRGRSFTIGSIATQNLSPASTNQRIMHHCLSGHPDDNITKHLQQRRKTTNPPHRNEMHILSAQPSPLVVGGSLQDTKRYNMHGKSKSISRSLLLWAKAQLRHRAHLLFHLSSVGQHRVVLVANIPEPVRRQS